MCVERLQVIDLDAVAGDFQDHYSVQADRVRAVRERVPKTPVTGRVRSQRGHSQNVALGAVEPGEDENLHARVEVA